MEQQARRDAESQDDDPPLRDSLRPRGPVQFDITQVREPGVVRLLISGEVDILTTPRLATELDGLVRRSRDDVVVDLRSTGFIDSAGLQILLGTARRLARASRKLSVICDEGPVLRVIELTRLGEHLGLTRGDEPARS
jgi:anti-anti-sigma factor